MTATILPFLPKSALSAQQNLAEFIRYAKEDLTVFGADLPWLADAWDITDYVRFPGKTTRVRLNFTTGDRISPQPFPALWGGFSRAYVRYVFGIKPRTTVLAKLSAIRQLVQTVERPLSGVMHLSANDFEEAAARARHQYSPGASYNIGKNLNELSRFLLKHKLLISAFEWSNSIPRPSAGSGHIRVGAEFDRRRTTALPSAAALGAIPKLYRSAKEPTDVMALCILALLQVAPMRISELLTLPVLCEHEEPSATGERLYGLRWWPAKGAQPQIKWVSKVWVSLAKEALGKIIALTTEARLMAKWYETHTEVYPRASIPPLKSPHARLTHLAAIFGLSKSTTEAKLNRARVRAYLHPSVQDTWVYDAAAALEALRQPLPHSFPIHDHRTGLRLADALFCVPLGFGKVHQKGTVPYPAPLTQGWLAARVASRADNQKTLFERHGCVDEAGALITVTSHQFRHWLNTLAQREGLDQLDIAAWSGRANVHQNEAYDHVPASTLHTQIKAIRGRDYASLKLADPEAATPVRAPISREDFLAAKYPAAHSTDLGICIHDFSLLPCQQHGDCTNCQEHQIIKAHPSQQSAATRRLEEASGLLASAQQAVAEGARGADRWVAHQARTVERLEQIVAVHQNPTIQDGALVALPSGAQDSEVRHVLRGTGGIP